MDTYPLSEGQKRLREHVRSLLPEWKAATEAEVQWKADGSKGMSPTWEVHKALQRRLKADPVVNNDPVTGQDLEYRHISHNYFEWIHRHSSTCSHPPDDCIWRWDRFRYGGVVSFNPPAYTGGDKADSTTYSLFELAENGSVEYADRSQCVYYHPSGIIEVGCNGNHRMLAAVLWGVTPEVFNPNNRSKHETIFKSGPADEEFHKALLALEDWASSLELEFYLYGHDNEASIIKQFCSAMTLDDWKDLNSYISFVGALPQPVGSYEHDHLGIQASKVSPWRSYLHVFRLQLLLEEIQNMQRRPKFMKWWVWLKVIIRMYDPSALERWHFNCDF